DGRPTWFHSLHTTEQVLALYDYIEARLLSDLPLPLPESLQKYVFDGFALAEAHMPSLASANERLP
ncbi:MAG: hypothetical protein J2P36_27260, partial [Ktedonobacteraceae bacterium]|nr:hypothetical protein [Ktedonobacteraceae bacterium]